MIISKKKYENLEAENMSLKNQLIEIKEFIENNIILGEILGVMKLLLKKNYKIIGIEENKAKEILIVALYEKIREY